jgi:hypothetical protein
VFLRQTLHDNQTQSSKRKAAAFVLSGQMFYEALQKGESVEMGEPESKARTRIIVRPDHFASTSKNLSAALNRVNDEVFGV